MISSEVISVEGLDIALTRKSALKNLYIRITPPDGSVTASAPLSMSIDEVKSFVIRKMPEILEARRKFQAQPRQTKREYVSGETCYLWGNPLMLRVIYGGKSKVEVFREVIAMHVPEGASITKRKSVLTEWYRHELKSVLPDVIDNCCRRVGVNITGWNVRNMRTRWGSCNITARRILLNLQLIKKPYRCLEYVVIHELVHLLEKNHTHRFRSLVERYCPNWRETRALLNSMPLDYVEDWS